MHNFVETKNKNNADTLRLSDEDLHTQANKYIWATRRAASFANTLFLMQEHCAKRASKLNGWCMWWVRTAHWLYQDLLLWFLDSCWDEHMAAYAAGLLHRHAVNSVTPEQLGGDYPSPPVLQVVI